MESSLSRNPPWPGSIVAVISIPAALFIKPNRRDPRCVHEVIIIPIQIRSRYGIIGTNHVPSKYKIMFIKHIIPTNDAITPSHVRHG